MRVNADGSIDGHIEWTPDGEALVRGKKRSGYYSPAFRHFPYRSGLASFQRWPDQQNPTCIYPLLTREHHAFTCADCHGTGAG